MGLAFRSEWRDAEDVGQDVITIQDEAYERVADALETHVSQVAGLVATYGVAPPVVSSTIVWMLGTPSKHDAYIGTDGITHSVTTTQKPGETPTQWQARHDAALAALKQHFPSA